MNKSAIYNRISSILGDIERLTRVLYAINATDIERYPENYEAASIDAAHRAEVITCRLRHLVYASTMESKDHYLLSAAEDHGVEISEHDGIMEIRLPAPIPNRKKWSSTEFLLEPFSAALTQYVRENHTHKFQHCVICFAHIYDRELGERKIRDYDNLEFKKFLDVAASLLLKDDSGLLCDAYHTTELGDTDCAKLFIMDSDRFSTWFDGRKNQVQSISDF